MIVHRSTPLNGNVWRKRSRVERACSLHSRGTLLPLGDLLQLTLDSASASEGAAVHLIERIIGRVEHEAARNADGNADCPVVKLDYKSLVNHDDSTPGERTSARERTRASQLACLPI
jgi:hypothetical protein